MKKTLALALTLICLVTLFGCSAQGIVKDTRRTVGTSEFFSESEINNAMDVAIAEFRQNFGGCTLKEICYNEEKTASSSIEAAKQYDATQAIILLLTFTTDDNGGADKTLNPNYTYQNFQCVLTASHLGQWKVQDWGY